MPHQFDADEFADAMRHFKQQGATADWVGTAAASEPATNEEKLKVRVIAARAKLQLMRNRSEALKDSLAEFQHRQNRLRA